MNQQPCDPMSLVDLSKSYGRIRALSDVTLHLPTGVTVLIGRNGAGKSTLCRIACGVEDPDSGHLARHGEPIRSSQQLREHKARVGWMPQALKASGSLSVNQYVSYAGWLKDLNPPSLGRAVEYALEVCQLTTLSNRTLRQLSGGMLRRVVFAGAIVSRPEILILDEPTVGLDPEQRSFFHEVIVSLSSTSGILLSTHLFEDAFAVGQRIAILDAGRIRHQCDLDSIPNPQGSNPTEALRAFFLDVVGANESDTTSD